jgi:hypothetical protein
MAMSWEKKPRRVFSGLNNSTPPVRTLGDLGGSPGARCIIGYLRPTGKDRRIA